jgi:hypothetical protein
LRNSRLEKTASELADQLVGDVVEVSVRSEGIPMAGENENLPSRTATSEQRELSQRN